MVRTCTHAQIHTHMNRYMGTHTHVHTNIYTQISCLVFSLPDKDHVAFQKGKEQKQQGRATTLLEHFWFTDSGHGACTTVQKLED